jgi:sugar phosphate isomerase/epimerase
MKVYASTTYLGPGRTRVRDALRGLEACGLDGVEIGSTHLHQDDFAAQARTWTGAALVHNYCPPAEPDMVMNIAAADPAQRRASVAHAKTCLRFAADIGAGLYTVHPGFTAETAAAAAPRGGERSYDFAFAGARAPRAEAFARMVDSLKELVDEAARLGVALAVETEGSVTKKGVLLMETPPEYENLFAAIPEGLGLNLNLAHTALAARVHGFDVARFVQAHTGRIRAVEISHNDGHHDSHAPLTADSLALKWIPRLPDVPLILEYRDASPEQVAAGAALVRSAA